MKLRQKNKIRKLSAMLTIFFIFRSFPAYPGPDPELPALQKGMSYVTWEKDGFASQYSDESLQKLALLGVEWLAVCVTHYQEDYDSTSIQRTDKTPSIASMIHVINTAHELGLRVMLKPHIDLLDKFDGTYWRADIGFTCDKDWEKWFKEYEEMILSYARLAEKLKVELFCVGTELSFAATRESNWRRIIEETKKVYSGKTVYAANWDNFKNINFWDALDLVGIDAYFPLSHDSTPTLESLKKGWEKWKCEIEAWQPQVNKNILFTEIGYPSVSHAPSTPWKSGTYGNADENIQALCYKAFFETMWRQPWLAGAYWWKWDTNVRAGGKNNRQFTPQNKIAQQIIEMNYKGGGELPDYAMASLR
ncbi:MAG: hypothetical protein ABIA77_04600 [Candidatus Omnitrophota bacterium]